MKVDRRRFLAASIPMAGAAVWPLGRLTPVEEPQGRMQLPAPVSALTSMKASEPPAITPEERWRRIEKAQGLMEANGLDGILMLGGTSMRYFGDVDWGRSERTFAMVVPRSGEIAWVCPAFEEQRARERIHYGEDIRVWQEHESPYALIAGILRDRGAATGRIGMEETTYYHVADGLGRDAPALSVTTADPVTKGCRAVKTPAEIALMRHANHVTITAFEAAFASLETGMDQARFGGIVSAAFRQLGYSGGGLILFGENSAYPHGTQNDQELAERMVVLCDGGTSAGGYQSDITRTAIYGEPTTEQRRVWTLVKDAQGAALEAAGPGVAAGDVDKAARDVITRGGYGPGYKYFTHRLGHGIGMDGHEWHYLVMGNQTRLEPGMSFSNEPGIYIYGSFGIRLEDIMVITEDGAELLTPQAATPTHPFG